MRLLKPRFEYVVTLACTVTLATFAWHGFAGDRGVDYLKSLETRHTEREAKLAELAKDRAVIEKKLQLLRPESVDPDLVEELARANLGLVKSTDLVIITGSTD